jgi:anti-sigma B factor antagonist
MNSSDLKIHRRKEQNIWILNLEGRLDAEQVAGFKKNFPFFLKEEAPHIVLDLKDLEFVDSTGLGSLIFFLRRLEEKGGSLSLIHLNKEVESILEITRLVKLFKVFPDLSRVLENRSK